MMFSNPKQVFIVPKPNQSTEIITFILMMGSYSFYKEEDLEKFVDFPVSSQPDDEESRKQSEKQIRDAFVETFLYSGCLNFVFCRAVRHFYQVDRVNKLSIIC